ncbi:FAD-dependent monooxygenase [Streptomyces sp. PLK6-54]|uniref:FAD-dependent monooxygenase n=2 Tax=Actinacidiphila acidipaludis TaxID=2873382 RepID=A0ABS7QEU2_9ACTN|nr:FAD-dependent monooxygenase [Streptomyces acidipaludis]
MLACELALCGTRPLLLERRTGPGAEARADGLAGQVVQVLDRRGLYTPLSGSAAPPQPARSAFSFAGLPLDLSLLPAGPLYTLAVPQRRVEEVLEERALRAGVEIRRGHELTGLAQDNGGVVLEVAGGPAGPATLRARYVVGADGADSAVRTLSGIGFPGVARDRSVSRQAHAVVPCAWMDPATGGLTVPGYGEVPPFLPQRTERGSFGYAPLPGRPALLTTTEWEQPAGEGPMTLAEMRASIRRVLGADLPLGPPPGDGPHVLRRLSGGDTRRAERMRQGQVFLAGDAAHVHAPGAGPGLSTALLDAVNLGWKLAAELRGAAGPALLDTYATERTAAARRALTYAQAQAALAAPGGEVTALRELLGELLGDRDAIQRVAALAAGADVRYAMSTPGRGAGHPLVGGFAPDLTLDGGAGPVRLAELARSGRPLLLDLTEDGSPSRTAGAWRERVQVVRAGALGKPSGVTALLVRPDGFVAWASGWPEPYGEELAALRHTAHHWFPPPAR